MTTHATSAPDTRRTPVVADLAFWTFVSAAVAVRATPAASTWGAPRAAVLIGAVAIFGTAVAGFVALGRKPVPARLVRLLGAANLALAPLLLLGAVLDLLDLTTAGDTALAAAAAVALVFGLWQYSQAGAGRTRA